MMSSSSVQSVVDSMVYRSVDARGMYGAGSELATGDANCMGGYREATVEQMFGTSSTLESSSPVMQIEPTLINEWLFQLLIIFGFVAYLYILWRSWDFMGSIWGGVLFRRSERHMRDEGGELPLNRFKIATTSLGLLILALVVVRFVDIMALPDAAIYARDVAWVVPIYALLAILLFVVWQYGLHRVVGMVTRAETMDEVAALGVMNFVRSIAIIYPFVVIWLLSPVDMLSTWSVVLCVLIVLMLLIYLKDTFLLFVGKKISILNWILYLCAAILLPISFLWRIIPDIFG